MKRNNSGVYTPSIHLLLLLCTIGAIRADKSVLNLDEQKLSELSEDLVKSIVSILNVQEAISKMTTDAVNESKQHKNATIFDTPRVFDSISKSFNNMLIKVTSATSATGLHRLIFGMARVATEISVLAVINETSYAVALNKNQQTDLNLRKKRAFSKKAEYDDQSNLNCNGNKHFTLSDEGNEKGIESLYRTDTDAPNFTKLINDFLNPRLGLEGPETLIPAILENEKDFDVKSQFRMQEKEKLIKNDNDSPNDNNKNDNYENMEKIAKYAILHGGDIAHLTAETLIALRRVLTASIAVDMALGVAKTSQINRQERLSNLARSAAHEASKEARRAAKITLSCEKSVKQAIKYTAEAHGAKSTALANRVLMDTFPLAALAKSVSYAATDIAMDSLYSATDGLFRRKFVINIVQA